MKKCPKHNYPLHPVYGCELCNQADWQQLIDEEIRKILRGRR